jgi:probable addiction module antidote protein
VVEIKEVKKEIFLSQENTGMIIKGVRMPRKAIDFDETLFELLKDPEEAAAYLNEHLAYKGKDRDELFLKALRKVVLAQGFDQIAQKSNLKRRSLDKALSAAGNPRFSTLNSLLEAVGLQIMVGSKLRKGSRAA